MTPPNKTPPDQTPANMILVYDQDCPVCRNYCRVLAIRQAAGGMSILNARDNPPIMAEINARGIDMDEGFVLKISEEFYHGADAIHMLALMSTRTGVFNRLNYLVFKLKPLSRFLYPILKFGRSILLKLLGKKKLNNLTRPD